MTNKPIFWGIIICIVSLAGWVVSVVLNVIAFGAFRWVSNAFGTIALLSIPLALVWKLITRNTR